MWVAGVKPLRITSVEIYLARMQFLTTFPALFITSNWSTYCSLIADCHALKCQLIARHRQKRECRLKLHPKPSNASTCKMSFWMTRGFLISPTITTMCFIILMEVLFCASLSILSQICMRQLTPPFTQNSYLRCMRLRCVKTWTCLIWLPTSRKRYIA